MQVITLGVSGSGKSNFMFSLLDSLHSAANARNGFYLKGKGHAFEDSLQHHEHSIKEKMEFARGTASETNRIFELRDSKKNWFDIGWFDYKGGIVNQYLSEEYEQHQAYYDILDLSSAMIVFINLYDILSLDDSNPREYIAKAKRYVGAENITNVFTYLNDNRCRDLDVLFVLSQCDTVESKYWDSKEAIKGIYESCLKPIFGSLFDIISNQPTWRCGIIPTSCVGIGNSHRIVSGEKTFQRGEIVKDIITREPEPINIVDAFFWLIKREFEKNESSLNFELNSLRIEKSLLETNKLEKINTIKEEYATKKDKRPYLQAILEDKFLREDGKIKMDFEMDARISEVESEYREKIKAVDKEIANIQKNEFPDQLNEVINQACKKVYEL